MLNFQISMALYLFAASALVFLIIGLFILPLLGIFIGVVTIVNTVKVAAGQDYHYPFSLDFLHAPQTR